MDELTDPAPISSARKNRGRVLLGALLGATALAGSVIGVGAIAGAQDSPSSDPTTDAEPTAPEIHEDDIDWEALEEDWEAFDECMADQLGDLWVEPEFLEGDFDGIPFDELDLDELDLEGFEGDFDELFEEFEGDFEDFPEIDDADIEAWEAADTACQEFLPEDVKAEIAAWAPFEECIDTQIGDLPDPWLGSEEPTDAEWEAHEEAWMAAEEACADLMPEEARAEMEAWDAFDQCLADAGVFDEGAEFGAVVHVETDDGFQLVEFSDVPGSVTISGDASGITIVTDGGVTLLDEAALDAEWEAYDAAYSECEKVLPEDLIDDGSFFDEEEMFED